MRGTHEKLLLDKYYFISNFFFISFDAIVFDEKF